ncbi:MAG: carboxypeptidase-like regulatory domain-containing protein [Bacteroidales bacterium]|nr:carboxypeptidase-like regulatory domain-containing protein [Bacteroidales bacterium]
MKLILRQFVILICVIMTSFSVSGQSEFKQEIRGQIVDVDTQAPLPGANIVVKGSDPLIGTTTDLDGYFLLKAVPVGRITLEVSYVGYHTKTYENLFVSVAKELMLEVALKQQSISVEEVEISAGADKKEPVNKLASVSAANSL